MLANLRTEMTRKKVRGKAMAKVIGCSEKTMSNKINEKNDFTRSEMFLINTTFFPEITDMRYLFESDNTLS